MINCKNCTLCGQPNPCDSCNAGGVCDEWCDCGEEYESSEDVEEFYSWEQNIGCAVKKDEKLDKALEIGNKMYAELKELIEEAEEAGCKDPLPEIKQLLNEWETFIKQ